MPTWITQAFLFVLLTATAVARPDSTPPVAVNDAYTTTNADNPSVDKPGVLMNDIDADPLTAILVDSSQATGVLKLNSDGSFEYEIPSGFVGVDVFTYKCNDGTSDSNLATVTFTVTSGGGAGDPGTFTDEAAFLAALFGAGYCSVSEGFEGDDAWDYTRSTIVDGFFTAPEVYSRGVYWSSNAASSEITTGSGASLAGAWGAYSYPHGNYPAGISDGIHGESDAKLVAVGGWVRTNAPPAKAYLYLDGLAQPVDFGGNASTLGAGVAKFFGVIVPAGFHTFEFREAEGSATEWKYLFFDKFTFGYDLTQDCNGNQVPDACDIATGTSTDCDLDGVPDECGPDCNNNSTPDSCEVITQVTVQTGHLSPIGATSPQSVVIPMARPAVRKVGLKFWAVADLGAAGHRFDIDVNGTPVGYIFANSYASYCPTFAADYDQLVLDAATFNAALTGGDAVVHIAPSSPVSATSCPNSYVRVEVAYIAASTLDADADGVPDSCVTVCQTDLGFGGPGNATLSVCGGDLSSGTSAELAVSGAAANQPGLLLISTQMQPTPFLGGTLVTIPIQLQLLLMTDAGGGLTIPGLPGGGGPFTVFLQFVYADPGLPLGAGLSNAVRLDLLP